MYHVSTALRNASNKVWRKSGNGINEMVSLMSLQNRDGELERRKKRDKKDAKEERKEK
jgi:hypothetical protein